MPRRSLDQNLHELREYIRQMYIYVDDVLCQILQALKTGEQTALSTMKQIEFLSQSYYTTAEKYTLRLLIIQQPLAGRDLRYLTAALHIEMGLYLMSTLLSEITQIVLHLLAFKESTLSYIHMQGLSLYTIDATAVDSHGFITELFVLRGLLDLGEDVRHIVQKTMQAFIQNDISAARNAKDERVYVEQRYQQIYQDVMLMLSKQSALSVLQRDDSSILQRVMLLLFVSQKLAKIGHHNFDICDHIIFVEEGEKETTDSQ